MIVSGQNATSSEPCRREAAHNNQLFSFAIFPFSLLQSLPPTFSSPTHFPTIASLYLVTVRLHLPSSSFQPNRRRLLPSSSVIKFADHSSRRKSAIPLIEQQSATVLHFVRAYTYSLASTRCAEYVERYTSIVFTIALSTYSVRLVNESEYDQKSTRIIHLPRSTPQCA